MGGKANFGINVTASDQLPIPRSPEFWRELHKLEYDNQVLKRQAKEARPLGCHKLSTSELIPSACAVIVTHNEAPSVLQRQVFRHFFVLFLVLATLILIDVSVCISSNFHPFQLFPRNFSGLCHKINKIQKMTVLEFIDFVTKFQNCHQTND